MSDKKLDKEEEKLLEEDMEDIANLLAELEEKLLESGIKLSESEMKTLSAVKVKLSEHQKAEKEYLKRIVQDGIDDGELEAVPGGVIDAERK